MMAARVFRVLRRAEELVLAWGIIGIAALSVANVCCRSIGFSLPFTEELSQFFIIGVTFVGLSYAAGLGRHIRMTAIYDQLSRSWRKAIMIVIHSATAAMMFVLAWYSVDYIETVRFLESVSPVLQVPLWCVYCFVPLGLGLSAIQYALAVIRNLTSPDVYISFEQQDEYEQTVTGEA